MYMYVMQGYDAVSHGRPPKHQLLDAEKQTSRHLVNCIAKCQGPAFKPEHGRRVRNGKTSIRSKEYITEGFRPDLQQSGPVASQCGTLCQHCNRPSRQRAFRRDFYRLLMHSISL